ncbi:hypothetical protein BGZ93_008401 [Podila epicladia]|nr:hypothetical protein BGZ92_000875 [Podila epicladia]KAG0099268.1 hypothetical protein BGZ93_008401 [Podila epicladia]
MSSPGIQNANVLLPEPSVPEPDVYVSTAKPRPPLTPEEEENMKKPTVLIVGAGLGGLTLAILLHKAKIPFFVYERAHAVKHLGSAMSLGPPVTNLFKQLGIFDEFQAMGKLSLYNYVYKHDLTHDFTLDFSGRQKIAGSEGYIIARPDMYDLLWRQIPRERIHMGKKFLSFLQNSDGVMIRFSDNTTIHGDILVGADGAHSAVRQRLFQDLKSKGKLPTSDDVPLPFNCVCLVGQTKPLDPEEFPDLKKDYSQFMTVHGSENMYSWVTFSTAKNTMCWMVVQQLDKESSKENDFFRNSEWGPEAAEAMCKEVRHFKVPSGREDKELTLGDLIDLSPKDLISKVMLEEKVFDTWFGGRTVLLGDSCHKLSPASGAGAINAIHDAVALANWIYTLESKSLSDLDTIFKEYYAERYPAAKASFKTSQVFSKMLVKNFTGMVTKTVFRRLPVWLWRRVVIKMSAARVQASFLPLVEDKGQVKPLPQPSLIKTLAILEQRKTKVAV